MSKGKNPTIYLTKTPIVDTTFDVAGLYIAPIKYSSNIGGVFERANGEHFYIKEVLFEDPATIVFWSDGTKTVNVTPSDVKYNGDAGLAFCVLKKLLTNAGSHDLFKSWGTDDINESYPKWKTLASIRRQMKKKK